MSKAVSCLVLFLVALPLLASAQGTYTQIDFPAAGYYTYATGINSAGDISGFYARQAEFHGFLLSGGLFTTIDYPGAFATLLYGLNDLGVVVGRAQISPTVGVGFSYDIYTQTFTQISYPDPSVNYTWPFAINNAGTIVGTAERDQGSNVFTIGFQYDGTTYQKINPEGLPAVTLTGINNLGETVGTASGRGSLVNFVYQQGRFRGVHVKGDSSQVTGINDADAIIGVQPTANNIVGFLLQDGVFQRLHFPGGFDTNAVAINNAGHVVGSFRDQTQSIHGFLWTP